MHSIFDLIKHGSIGEQELVNRMSQITKSRCEEFMDLFDGL